jgi:CubicO group peptidase (beta-lactamase class C family)
MSANKHKLILIASIVFTFISCMKDEPLKRPYSGFTPVDIRDEWILSSPGRENMDSLKLDEAFRYFYREDQFLLGRSMTIIRNGKIVAEAYSREQNDIHQIQNIKLDTKSFTGILTCIALQKGILDSVEQRFSDIYPEYFENHQDLKEITIEQALTMRTGLVRDNKDDGYNFLMTENTVEFAKEYLFDPLSIDSSWVSEATKQHVWLNGWAYGYFIWLNPADEVYWAAGHGGQTIMVAPDKNLVMVVTAWPYVDG